MKIITLLLIIVIVVMLYLGLSYYFTPVSTITKKVYLANGIPDIPLKDLPSLGASKYSYELWIYVNHVDGAIASTPTPTIYPTNPNGTVFRIADSVSLEMFKDGSAKLSIGSNVIPITDKFPLQRWEYVIINVDNNLVEVYLDGKLLRSVKTPSTIATPTITSNLTFGKGNIYLSSFNRNLYTIDQTAAYKNYLNGNNGLRLTNFGVSFDLLKNSSVAYNYSLF